MFAWYWVADPCEDNNFPFVLNHVLHMQAEPAGKSYGMSGANISTAPV